MSTGCQEQGKELRELKKSTQTYCSRNLHWKVGDQWIWEAKGNDIYFLQQFLNFASVLTGVMIRWPIARKLQSKYCDMLWTTHCISILTQKALQLDVTEQGFVFLTTDFSFAANNWKITS